jgi:hypothetical protein
MGKYEPLSEFLRSQSGDEVAMSFRQIERIIGDSLPESAKRHRAWWSNNGENSAMTQAWLNSGFRSSDVDMKAGTLVFKRAHPQGQFGNRGQKRAAVSVAALKQHPLVGWMKGSVTVAPGVDLTRPADPDWQS